MLKREKIIYSLFFIVTIALSSTVAFLYLNLRDSQVSLDNEKAREMSVEAYAVNMDVERLVGRFYNLYWNIQGLDYQLSQGFISNETWETLYDSTLIDSFGNYYSSSYGGTIAYDINNLKSSYDVQTNRAYQNISDTLQYSLDQIDFAWQGRTHNDSHQLIGELYFVLGINQETQIGNWTALRGISESFYEMSIYWEEQSGSLLGQNVPSPNIQLDWALANATQLYQSLADWHNNNPFQSQ